MTEWDGRGLPPAARARVERAGGSGVTSSFLSIRGQVATQSVGLDPIGDVMGCMVERIGWTGWGGCGVYYAGFGGGYQMAPPPVTSSSRYGGYAPYVNALYAGWDTAMHRMVTEAQALGADGVVGVTTSRTRLGDADTEEFLVRGTAVRAHSKARPRSIFTTDLNGGDVTKLLHAGWAPTQLVWGISVTIRHDDYQTRAMSGPFNRQNVEVPGYSELVTYARDDARSLFSKRCASHGADAATVSQFSLKIREIERGENHRDHVAESTIVGNALAKFHPGAAAQTDSRVVLPLRRSSL